VTSEGIVLFHVFVQEIDVERSAALLSTYGLQRLLFPLRTRLSSSVEVEYTRTFSYEHIVSEFLQRIVGQMYLFLRFP
jgi:hypothetical protein